MSKLNYKANYQAGDYSSVMSKGITAQRLEEAMEERGLDQSELARIVGCSPAAINQILSGKTRNSRFLPVIATRLGKPLSYLQGASNDPDDYGPRSADLIDSDEVQIDSIDLAYGMGGTFLDSDAVEVSKSTFSRGWLRQYTESPPASVIRCIRPSMTATESLPIARVGASTKATGSGPSSSADSA